jgi:hypothetical protein
MMSLRRGTMTFMLGLCVIGLASGCGETAAEKRLQRVNSEVRTYTTTLRTAAKTLSRLRAPAGFRSGASCSQRVGGEASICFTRTRTVVLDDQTMTELVRETGAYLERNSLSCSTPRSSARPRVRLIACTATATLGGERLVLTAQSLAVVRRKMETPTGQSVVVPADSEIVVTDVGH